MKGFFLIILTGIMYLPVLAQGVKVGPGQDNPDPAAVLELESFSQGFLPPRMTSIQRDQIQSPIPMGLIIFNSDTRCTNVYDGMAWREICGSCIPGTPEAPVADVHVSGQFDISWNWQSVSTASGYKVNSVNDLGTASDIGNFNSYSQAPLSCGSSHTLYVWAYNACGYSSVATFTTSTSACPFTCGSSTMEDYDGNTYNTVLIGTQCWMKENLRTTSYQNGTAIPNVANGPTWTGLTTGAWCYSGNDPSYNLTYGKLYNWFAMKDANGICPAGWHVPSSSEWNALSTFLGGVSAAGGKMKATGLTYWSSPNTGATNSSGFTGLGGGYRSASTANFGDFLTYAYMWSSTNFNADSGHYFDLRHNTTDLWYGTQIKQAGLSIRCLKD